MHNLGSKLALNGGNKVQSAQTESKYPKKPKKCFTHSNYSFWKLISRYEQSGGYTNVQVNFSIYADRLQCYVLNLKYTLTTINDLTNIQILMSVWIIRLDI